MLSRDPEGHAEADDALGSGGREIEVGLPRRARRADRTDLGANHDDAVATEPSDAPELADRARLLAPVEPALGRCPFQLVELGGGRDEQQEIALDRRHATRSIAAASDIRGHLRPVSVQTRRSARRHSTRITTLPKCAPLARYAYASLASAKPKVRSMIGSICRASSARTRPSNIATEPT